MLDSTLGVSGIAKVGPGRAQALLTGELFYAHARGCVLRGNAYSRASIGVRANGYSKTTLGGRQLTLFQ